MKTSDVGRIFSLFSVSVFWTSLYANMVYRHYTVHVAFTNRVFNINVKVEYIAKSLIECSASCDEHCDCFGFNSRTRKCRVFKTCSAVDVSGDASGDVRGDVSGDEFGWKYYIPEYPVDCHQLFKGGETTSGVYVIRPPGELRLVTVYCDMATSGGGWTVIQNRLDGTVNFHRSWEEFKTGFGDVSASYWIGNAIIYQLTKDNSASLYISITDVNGGSLYIEYDHFSILGEDHQYRLNITGAYSGTLEDSIRDAYTTSVANGMGFTTYDQDNDNSTKNCAVTWGGGWWFNDCSDAFLNGPFHPPEDWLQPWDPPYLDGREVARTKMMIRRRI